VTEVTDTNTPAKVTEAKPPAKATGTKPPAKVTDGKQPAKLPAKPAPSSDAKKMTSVTLRKKNKKNKKKSGNQPGNALKGGNKKLHHRLSVKEDKNDKTTSKQPAVNSMIDDCATNSFKKLRSGKEVML
jgi:hypothetical protein